MKKKKGLFQARYPVLLAMVLISAVCILAIYNEVKTTFDIKGQIGDAEKVKSELETEKSSLIKMSENLNNTDYILRYARGRYMVTKDDGEQVFKLPVEDQK